MAFVLKKENTVWWPVTIKMPTDGGELQDVKCQAKFKILTTDEYEALKKASDIEFLCAVVVDFGDDIKDEAGLAIPCNEKTKHRLFKSAGYVRLGFVAAYHEAAGGYREKN